MTTLINLLVKLKNIILFFLPLSYICYIIYMRIILERGVRQLDLPLSKVQIFFTVFLIFMLIIRIYLLLKTLQIIKEKENKPALVVWLLEKANWLSQHYSQIWIDFHRFFVAKNVKIHTMVQKLGVFLGNHETPRFMLTIIIIFQVLPKVIVVGAFLFDLVVYMQFYYFYKVLGLLLLPLVYTALKAMLFQFYTDNSEFFKEFITVNFVHIPNSYSYKPEYAFVEGYTPPPFVKDIDDFVRNHMSPIVGIKRTVRLYDACMVYYKLYWVFLIILNLYFFGWSYILFSGV